MSAATAQTNSSAPPASGATQQLQWSAVDVDAAQFKGLRDLAVNALGMRPVVDQPNFSVLVAANGSLFEIYGPGAPDNPWRHGQGGVAVGFLTGDIVTTTKAIQTSGCSPQKTSQGVSVRTLFLISQVTIGQESPEVVHVKPVIKVNLVQIRSYNLFRHVVGFGA